MRFFSIKIQSPNTIGPKLLYTHKGWRGDISLSSQWPKKKRKKDEDDEDEIKVGHTGPST